MICSRPTIHPPIGLTADCRVQVTRMRQEAHEFKFKFGYDMPVHVLAKRIADICQVKSILFQIVFISFFTWPCQVYTQEASLRMLACTAILARSMLYLALSSLHLLNLRCPAVMTSEDRSCTRSIPPACSSHLRYLRSRIIGLLTCCTHVQITGDRCGC